MPVIDGLLVATAQVYGLALVTRNASNTIGRGVEIINPYAVRP